MIPLEGASGELTMDLRFVFEAASLGMVDGSDEVGLKDTVGCRGGELVDLRVRDGSSGGGSYEWGW